MIEKREQTIGVGTCNVSDLAKRYVREVLDSNRLTYGPFSKKFEQMFASAHGCKFAVFLNSGTSALRIAVAALKEKYGWADGDEVLLPSITFIADLNVVTNNRLTPVFVDVHPKEYNMDPGKIEAKITTRTRCILPTHLFGLSADMESIMAIAKKHSLRVIEDGCEASFAAYRGKPVGSFGDISCFSTYQAHILTTGVGGFAATNDPELAVILRSLANHGRDGIYMQIDDDNNKTNDELREIISRRFTFVRPGYSFRATEMEAAVGVADMEDGLEDALRIRRDNALALIDVLTPFADTLQLPTWPNEDKHVFMMFPVVVKDASKVSRDALINYLEQYNIETRMMLPLINQPFVIKQYGNLGPELPVADHINKNGFYIGCHTGMTSDDFAYIGRVFRQFFDEHGKT